MDRDLFPYVNGRLDLEIVGGLPRLQPVDGANEYPILTGVLMWLPSLVASDADEYLLASAVVLAPFGLLTAFLLARMTALRALLWAASPPLLLYAFHNWDLPVVAAAVGGVWFWHRGRPTAAAMCFGIGGALKLYPLTFLAPLALEQSFAGDRRRAVRLLAVGTATTAAINLPVLLAEPAGWAVPYRFHFLRIPNYDSLWGEALRLGVSLPVIGAVSSALLVVAAAAVLVVAARRARTDDGYPFVQACAGLLAVFLLFNKVHSPQYVLWILPFFALLDVRIRWWAAAVISNAILYAAIFVVSVFSEAWRNVIVSVSVYARVALLAALVVVFLRARPVLSRARGGAGGAVSASSRSDVTAECV
jgi:uncharacterized membrane protein